MTKHASILAALSQMSDVFHVWDGELGPKVLMQPWGKATQLTWSQAESFTSHILAPRKMPQREMGRKHQHQQLRKAR